MKKSKFYYPVQFPCEVLQRAESTFEALIPAAQRDKVSRHWEATVGREGWTYDTTDEFYADYRRGPDQAYVKHSSPDSKYEFHFQIVDGVSAQLHVAAPTRAEIESVFAVLYEAEISAKVAPRARRDITVFVSYR